MSLGKYLILMSICTLVCFGSLGYVLLNIDPTQTNILGFSFFYLSLGLGLVGLLSLVGSIFNKKN